MLKFQIVTSASHDFFFLNIHGYVIITLLNVLTYTPYPTVAPSAQLSGKIWVIMFSPSWMPVSKTLLILWKNVGGAENNH